MLEIKGLTATWESSFRVSRKPAGDERPRWRGLQCESECESRQNFFAIARLGIRMRLDMEILAATAMVGNFAILTSEGFCAWVWC
jgi:hypothetical protein